MVPQRDAVPRAGAAARKVKAEDREGVVGEEVGEQRGGLAAGPRVAVAVDHTGEGAEGRGGEW